MLPFSYALAQLHPLLNSVPSSNISSPFELPLRLLLAEVDTFLTDPLLDLWDVVVDEVIVLGADTLLPPFAERVCAKNGDGNGEGTTGVVPRGFRLRARLLFANPCPVR